MIEIISEEDWVEDTVNDKDISWAEFERDLISFNDEGCKIDRGAQNTWLKKIGEDATEKWMKANNITYVKDNQLIHPDKGDFNCNNILIDVKASHYRFNDAETGLQSKVLVNDQQLAKKVYDIYVFVKLDTTPDDFWVKYNLKHTPKIINVKGEHRRIILGWEYGSKINDLKSRFWGNEIGNARGKSWKSLKPMSKLVKLLLKS